LSLPFRFGHTAVNVFIVLSGFSLMLPVARSATYELRGGLRPYFVRRARRILPPYYAALALSLVMWWILHATGVSSAETVRPQFEPGNVTTHVALVHNLSARWFDGINPPFWSVATEWQIYFLFPFALLPAWRRWGAVGLFCAAISLSLLPITWPPTRFFVACPWYIALFAIGCGGAIWSARASATNESACRQARLVPWVVGGAGILLTLAFLVAGRRLSPMDPCAPTESQYLVQMLKDGAIGLAACGLILHAVNVLRAPSRARREWVLALLESRVARNLGAFSYSIYLTHSIVFFAVLELLNRFHGTSEDTRAVLIRAVVVIPVGLLFAYVFHLGFERPFQKASGRKPLNLPPEDRGARQAGVEGDGTAVGLGGSTVVRVAGPER
jgi:peptidoglycan/LPS O-acetylase OafA/YrhL